MQQRIAPERCSRKFSEPYPLEEGNIVARFLQVNLRKDHSRTYTLHRCSQQRAGEREGGEREREGKERERGRAGEGGTETESRREEKSSTQLD